ncbi:MAG: hypothetical protein NC114_09875 [Ruminococcus flavefaciens]|nr:hypothetical protein [Ruminococcus flavefaciens]
MRNKKNKLPRFTAGKKQPKARVAEDTTVDLEERYQTAVDSISIEGWISRLGEEASELAAAISKYERVKNKTFPCGMSEEDAKADMITEMIDVELAMEAVKKKMAGSTFMAKYSFFENLKKNKLVKQVNRALANAQKRTRPNCYPQLGLYMQCWLDQQMDHNNPMRDAIAEDLYD